MMIDPTIFLAGTVIPFMLLLEAIGHSPFRVFQTLSLANDVLATSNVVATIAPMGVISSLTAMAAVVKLVMNLAENPNRRIGELLSRQDGRFHLLLFLCSVFLLLFTIILLSNFEALVTQSNPLRDEDYWAIWLSSVMCISISFMITVMLSARDIPLKEMVGELTDLEAASSDRQGLDDQGADKNSD